MKGEHHLWLDDDLKMKIKTKRILFFEKEVWRKKEIKDKRNVKFHESENEQSQLNTVEENINKDSIEDN